MIFNKNKNQLEVEKQQELERIRTEDRMRHEQMLHREEESHRNHNSESPSTQPTAGYRFFEPNPKPKELVSVLKNMFKKLFPEAKKAYLLLTQYEDKKGYLLIVDIDARFLKIINIYLDGETKMVRHGMPIECILYSKTGSLTDGIRPFYEKPVSELPQIPTPPKALRNGMSENGVMQPEFPPMPEFLTKHIPDVEEPVPAETVSEPAKNEEHHCESESKPQAEYKKDAAPEFVPSQDEATVTMPEPKKPEPKKPEPKKPEPKKPEPKKPEPKKPEPKKPEPKKTTSDTSVKVVPETKQHLFALMNRAGGTTSGETMSIAKAGFGEFRFYIPYSVEVAAPEPNKIAEQFPENEKSKIATVINPESGIKAVPFFTEEADAVKFAGANNYGIVRMKYKHYKKVIASDGISVPSVEGIIINPFTEQIVLPPDYPLL